MGNWFSTFSVFIQDFPLVFIPFSVDHRKLRLLFFIDVAFLNVPIMKWITPELKSK